MAKGQGFLGNVGVLERKFWERLNSDPEMSRKIEKVSHRVVTGTLGQLGNIYMYVFFFFNPSRTKKMGGIAPIFRASAVKSRVSSWLLRGGV